MRVVLNSKDANEPSKKRPGSDPVSSPAISDKSGIAAPRNLTENQKGLVSLGVFGVCVTLLFAHSCSTSGVKPAARTTTRPVAQASAPADAAPAQAVQPGNSTRPSDGGSGAPPSGATGGSQTGGGTTGPNLSARPPTTRFEPGAPQKGPDYLPPEAQKLPGASVVHFVPVDVKTEASMTRGAKLWADKCACCHGAKGEGVASRTGSAQDLRNSRLYKYGCGEKAIFRTVRYSIPGSSMPFASDMNDQDTWAVTHFNISLIRPETNPVKPK